jgi:RNA-binding protein
VVQIGTKGLSPAVLNELTLSLEHHELMKVKVSAEDREARTALISELCQQLPCDLIQQIGNIALIYRPASTPRLVVPA